MRSFESTAQAQHVFPPDPVHSQPTEHRRTCLAIPCSQFFAVFSLRQRARFASNIFSAACRNVGTLALRFSANGSPPARTSFRFW